MIVLGVAVERAHMHGMAVEPFVERLAALGVGAIEAQLSPDMRSDEIAHWGATIEAAAGYGLVASLHVPMPLDDPAWPELLRMARAAPATVPRTLLVHGCSGPRPDPRLAERSVEQLRRLAGAAPDLVFALENGANVEHGPLARLRAWVAQRQRQARASARPQGIGSGMGAPRATTPALDPQPVDAPYRPRPRHTRWNAAGDRAAALAICDAVARPNCVFAWDLAHDWLAARAPGAAVPTVPDAALLRRVGYVRVHDVDDNGVDHHMLVLGNVPYTTQLRALLAAGYAGTVCLAARYTAAMRPYGGRWQTLERSLRVLQQTLRLL